jgi:GntR family transcriptional repressor for pyruvate dehydrogenase complex
MNLQIKPITRRSTVDQVVERIRGVIDDHNLAAGERLPGEFELVEQLQVSRPVLREALARLQSHGLVDIQRGRGTFVGGGSSLMNCAHLLRTAVTISPRELLSYAELRTAIEVQAARQAAERATEEDIADLEKLLADLNREDRPYAEVLEFDFRFHRKLIEAARNELMRNLMEVIYEFVLTQMARTTPSPRGDRLGRKLHREIVAAVKAHDPDAAERAMRQHMQAMLKRLETSAREPVHRSKPAQKAVS